MITALVSAETVLIVLLIALVAGLLRSHAEILRRLGPAGDLLEPAAPGASGGSAAASLTAPARVPGAPAAALAGPTPDGDAIRLDFTAAAGAPTLLAFLTSGCTTCAGFWDTLGAQPAAAGVQTVIVTHGEERERPARLRTLAPAGVPVIMSSQAWTDYQVPGSPYFVLVDGSIRGEGVATTPKALRSLVGDAIEERRESAGTVRAGDAERTLAAAGVGPDHPSLYPADRPEGA